MSDDLNEVQRRLDERRALRDRAQRYADHFGGGRDGHWNDKVAKLDEQIGELETRRDKTRRGGR